MSAAEELDRLVQEVERGHVLSDATFAGLDADNALDERDRDPFDSAWTQVYNSIDGEIAKIDPSTTEMIKALSEAAYLRVYAATENPELAAYISDDFELIANGVVLDLADPWLNALWLSYAKHQFPTGDLQPAAGRLRHLVRAARR